MTVFYSCYGIYKNRGHKDAFWRNLPYLGLLGVGLGSTIFHASLKYYTQWCDDLSMLVAVALVLHRVYSADRSLTFTVGYGIGLTALLVAFGVYHCMTDEVAGHNVFFAIMIIGVGLKTHALIRKNITDPDLKKQISRMSIFGGVIFVTGYLIWILDHLWCNNLISIRRAIGMPWSFVFELHGYWHIFTGIGAYVFIALSNYLTGDEVGQKLGGKFAWPVNWVVDGTVGNDEPNSAASYAEQGEEQPLLNGDREAIIVKSGQV